MDGNISDTSGKEAVAPKEGEQEQAKAAQYQGKDTKSGKAKAGCWACLKRILIAKPLDTSTSNDMVWCEI
jgi:hypothetical protein